MGKPTGIIGPLMISSNLDGSISASFTRTEFPRKKSEVERLIVDRFIRSANHQFDPTGKRNVFSNPVQNDENNVDFNFSTPNGLAELELMEIAPLDGPYDDAQGNYKSYDLARFVFEKITEKRYPKGIQKDLFLLLYVTHWAFALTGPAMACIQYWCARSSPVFRGIFYFQPLDQDQGVCAPVFPVPLEDLGNFDPEQIRGQESIHFDPQKWMPLGTK